MKDKITELKQIADYLRETKLPAREKDAIERVLSAAVILDEIADQLEKE